MKNVFFTLLSFLLVCQVAIAEGDSAGNDDAGSGDDVIHELPSFMSVVADFSFEADSFKEAVAAEKSYERSHVAAERLASAATILFEAAIDESECARLKLLVKSVKHRFNVLKTGFNTDHAIWKIETMDESFANLQEAFAIFSQVAADYITSQPCEPTKDW